MGEVVYRASNQAHAARRPLDTPAPTVLFSARANKVEWMDSDIAHDPKASGRKVTAREAGILQGFPADYPWRGPVSRQKQQIGNAVPPPMAAALLSNLIT